MLTLPNYQINNQIYESANSLVYRGVRKKDNQAVILKVLKEDYPTPEELMHYQQEYEITQSLNIGGVVKTYGIEKYQNTLVIVLEDFGGKSLKQFLINQTFSIKEFLPLFIQMAEALGQIHSANIIHKDINPANIVWNQETHQLKIIDFGIASRLPRENPTLKNPEQLEGTLAYLSPEQTGRMNRSLDYRTDLYSLGVTFYELLTGSLPFESDSAMELVHCHIAKTPKPVSEINPDIPKILSDIVMKLMAKNVEDRYQSAFGVKFDLEKCLALSKKVFGKKLFSTQFQLAQNDFSGKLQIPQKLYGRENEINTLLQAFERVSFGATEMMLVAGYSGVGKTALVHEVHKPMTSKNGYFASGKFDQFQKNIPYSAISQAFNQFCRYLLMENAENLANWKTQILDAVGNNGQIIIDVIPDLELVIGKQPAVAEVGATEAQNRFNLFFRNFVKTLCDKEHPFILFLDDLQWADLGSLNLLKSILLDDEIKHLFIIGAYRDNEVGRTHSFMIARDELQKANVVINTIFLTNLVEDDINLLLQDSLSCQTKLTQPLTDLIYQKTQGNAFFTHQFLQTLYIEALLRFNFTKLKWQWDVEQIAGQNITANVVDLMAKKINKLPLETSKTLQLAACIGNQFDLAILAIINNNNKNNILYILRPALTEGLIQPLDENYKHLETLDKSQFKFLHDRIQQAAYALIDDKQKRAVHLQIGRLLLKNTPTTEIEEKAFDIVEQFNQSIDLLKNQAERLEIAKLNLIAGKKAKMATAYGSASNYLTKGQQCLARQSWENEYDLTFNLFIEATECAYFNGDWKQMEQLAQIVLRQARTLSDEVKICEIQIPVYATQGQQRKVITVALKVLKRLGIHFPAEPTQEDVGLALQKIQASLSEQSIQALLDLPQMTNANMKLAMRLMVATIPAAFQTLPNLLVLLILKKVELSLQYGNVYESSYAYVFYGVILSAFLGKIETGYKFGQMGLDLLKQLGEEQLKTKIIHAFNSFIRYKKEHAKETLQPLLANYQTGLETGDIEFASFSINTYCCYSYFTGKQLEELEEEMALYSYAIARLKLENAVSWNHLFWQVILNLRGRAIDSCRLIGEAYDENVELERYQQANDRYGIYQIYFNRFILHYLFQEYTVAVNYAEIAEQYLDGATSLLVIPIFFCYDSLARLALYPNLPSSEQAIVLAKVSANQQKMQNWAFHAPMNFQHKYDLIEAEKARILGQLNAIEWYEKAIAGAKENEYLHEEALAYELAAKFYLERGMAKFAQTYLKEAHYRYQQWGAVAKVKHLEECYPQWLASASPKSQTLDFMMTGVASKQTLLALNSKNRSLSSQLGLESVMKASQTLSGEIVLSKLLANMMHIVIENAGAEKGFLLLPQQNHWFIEAEGHVKREEVTVLQSVALEACSQVPINLIHYVARTQENVVLSDVSAEGSFTQDAYILKQKPKSVLGMPLLNQGKLTSILYLENNLTIGAFTQNHLEVLKLLSSQLAISIENALLYRTLEEKVEQRTAQLARRTEQLAQANEEITALNEQLKSENIRMSAELDVSRQLQQMLLPKDEEFAAIDGLDIAGFMEPADEVGGDYYDVLQHAGRTLFAMGDVTGHGLASGAFAIMVQSAVRTLLAYDRGEPIHFLNALNQMVFHNAARMNTGKTLTLALISYRDHQLFLTGQHEEIIVVRQGELALIDTTDLGFPLGLEKDIANFVDQVTLPLNTGDVVVLYTDGITEAENIDKQLYGLERLCEIIRQHWQKTAQEIQQAVIEDVRTFIGEQKIFDDITLLVLKQK